MEKELWKEQKETSHCSVALSGISQYVESKHWDTRSVSGPDLEYHTHHAQSFAEGISESAGLCLNNMAPKGPSASDLKGGLLTIGFLDRN